MLENSMFIVADYLYRLMGFDVLLYSDSILTHMKMVKETASQVRFCGLGTLLLFR